MGPVTVAGYPLPFVAWRIPCDAAELAVELAARAEPLGLAVVPYVTGDPVSEAIDLAAAGEATALVLAAAPTPDQLVALSRAGTIPLAMLEGPIALARELDLPASGDLEPLLATLALDGVDRPWEASTRGLGSVDRVRLGSAGVGGSEELRWESAGDGDLTLHHPAGTTRVGHSRAAAEALDALRVSARATRPRMPTVEGVDPEAVLEVILGPPRSLSDPASKAALAAYDVPLPEEVLCTSPSRAASEAAQLGFPVRLALASPDLRLWDHPDLVADGVDNAARVRDVFRQMMALGATRADRSRLLGVTVSATTSARALMWIEASSLTEGLVRARLGFADPHGLAARDATELVLPCDEARVERALRRLRGHPLLLGDAASIRREVVGQLTDLLLRVAAFVDEWRAEVEAVRIQPLAVLLSGAMEARDVCVEVGDAFSRSLRSAAP